MAKIAEFAALPVKRVRAIGRKFAMRTKNSAFEGFVIVRATKIRAFVASITQMDETYQSAW